MADVKVKVAEGKKLYWRGRDRVGGEIVEVPEKEARLIVAVKKGTLVASQPKEQQPKQPVPEPRPLRGRAMKAEESLPSQPVAPMTTENTESLTPRSGRYSRRDMKAEGE